MLLKLLANTHLFILVQDMRANEVRCLQGWWAQQMRAVREADVFLGVSAVNNTVKTHRLWTLRLYEFVALSPRPPRAPGCSHLRPSECTSADPASSFTKFVSSQLCKDSYVSCQLRPSQCVGARSSDPSQLRMRVLTPRRSSSRVATWPSGIIGSQRKLHPVICCLLN